VRPDRTEENRLESAEAVDGPETPAEPSAGRLRWWWVEPTVWTDRMLTALENGVKGGVWHSVADKVWKPEALAASWRKVRWRDGAAGVDRETVRRFEKREAANLERLAAQLRGGTYRPQAVRRAYVKKLGSREKRPLGIPTVRDRIAQGAVRHVLEPIFERDFAEHSYGFRPGRSCKDALRRVAGLLESGLTWVVDADLKSYFDSIPHDRLLKRVRAKVVDGKVLGLVEAFLKQKVLEGMESWTPEEGTPQGAVLSPLLANLYLDPLDHEMARWGFAMTRYADDFVVQCRSEAEAGEALDAIRAWTQAEGLTLHPEKTRIVDERQPGGFDFLGYHFECGRRWPRKKSLKKIKDSLRAVTRRTSGQSLERIIEQVNQRLRGWFGYFKHSRPSTFRDLDSWVRGRLRSILRKRRKRKGRARGADHQRWPNAYFAQRGLWSLVAARVAAGQPA
jgi:RNA-directed DNA polymerase